MKSIFSFSLVLVYIVIFNSCQPPVPMEKLKILCGTFTDRESKGVYLLNFDPNSGEISNERLAYEAPNPTFLTTSKDGKKIYTAERNDTTAVVSFRYWDTQQNKFTLINKQNTLGVGPCHVALNGLETLITINNYNSGSMAVFRTKADGGIEGNPAFFQREGSSIVPERQDGPHAHFGSFNKSGDIVYSNDLGLDKVFGYRSGNGRPVEFVALELDPGDGPRHFDFHPTKPWVFIVNELSGTVTSALIKADGTFETISKASTLPADWDGHKQCADIHVSNDGRFVYASNRGHNTIGILSIDEDGKIKLINNQPTGGDWPRNFAFSPDGNFLLAANRHTDNVVVFKVDKETGLLNETGFEAKVPSPVCLKFF